MSESKLLQLFVKSCLLTGRLTSLWAVFEFRNRKEKEKSDNIIKECKGTFCLIYVRCMAVILKFTTLDKGPISQIGRVSLCI